MIHVWENIKNINIIIWWQKYNRMGTGQGGLNILSEAKRKSVNLRLPNRSHLWRLYYKKKSYNRRSDAHRDVIHRPIVWCISDFRNFANSGDILRGLTAKEQCWRSSPTNTEWIHFFLPLLPPRLLIPYKLTPFKNAETSLQGLCLVSHGPWVGQYPGSWSHMSIESISFLCSDSIWKTVPLF